MNRFEQRLKQATRTYLDAQAEDGGWGLRPKAPSSIVNTAEVLAILHTSDIFGSPSKDGLQFLAREVRAHSLPAPQGRGAFTRFIVFALLGLTEYPEYRSRRWAIDAADWSREWLFANSFEGGWPEAAGQQQVSLFQTATALEALVRYDPDDAMIPEACQSLLDRSLTPGVWAQHELGSAPSSSVTALSIVGLVAAKRVDAAPPQTAQAIKQGVKWLLANRERWQTEVEAAGADVPGADWKHIAYSFGLQACLVAGVDPMDPRLRVAVEYLDDVWSVSGRQWCDKKGDNPTVRGSYAVVRAHNALRQSISGSATIDILVGVAKEHRDGGGASDISIRVDMSPEIVMTIRGRATRVRLSERQWTLVNILSRNSDGSSVSQLSLELDVAPGTVRKEVSRVNRRLTEACPGIPELIARNAGLRTYRLAVAS